MRGSTAHRRARRTARLALAILSSISGAAALAQDPPLKQAVEAAYLVKFAAFVEWPGTAFASPTSPFSLCVVTDPTFAGLVREAAAGQLVQQHPVRVRDLASSAGAAGCHVLFATGSPGDLASLRGQPVLTVTDTSDLLPGAVMNFVVRDHHVRFAISAAAAEANHLRISSQLMALADNIRQK